MLDQQFEKQKSKNTEAYQYLYDIEIILRELAGAKLEELHGKQWVKRGLPSDLWDKVKNSVIYEQKSKWHTAILHHPTYYLDFPDLKKILIGGANWSSLFAEIFGQKMGTESSLSELELLRNQIAHNRFVSEADLTILKGIHSKLMHSIPETDLVAARRSASNRVPIVALLQELADSVRNCCAAMMTGDLLMTADLPNGKIVTAWWFDESYLGENVEDVKFFAEICVLYSQIPSGIGQAVYRRSWIAGCDALGRASKAEATMNALLARAKDFYDQSA